MTPATYNGTFTILTASPNAFSYTLNTNPGGVGTKFGTALVSGQSVIPDGNIVLKTSGGTGTIQFTPSLNAYTSGAGGGPGVGDFQGPTPATITLTLTSGSIIATQSFTVTIDFVNSPPTISPIANQTVLMNTTSAPIDFTVGDFETPTST